MKKLLLVLSLLFCLTACGSTNNEEQNKDDQNNNQQEEKHDLDYYRGTEGYNFYETLKNHLKEVGKKSESNGETEYEKFLMKDYSAGGTGESIKITYTEKDNDINYNEFTIEKLYIDISNNASIINTISINYLGDGFKVEGFAYYSLSSGLYSTFFDIPLNFERGTAIHLEDAPSNRYEKVTSIDVADMFTATKKYFDDNLQISLSTVGFINYK